MAHAARGEKQSEGGAAIRWHYSVIFRAALLPSSDVVLKAGWAGRRYYANHAGSGDLSRSVIKMLTGAA